MKNEKILSNEELLDITAGFTLSSETSTIIHGPILKYGIRPEPIRRPILKYGVLPIQTLYAVRPTYTEE